MIENISNANISEITNDFTDQLLHLSKNGMWNTLEQEPVSFSVSGSSISIFCDDTWDFTPYRVGTEYTVINFRLDGKKLSTQFTLELKAIALAYLYYSRYSYRINTINSKISCLKRLAIALSKNNYYSFEGLTIDLLKKMIRNKSYTAREIDIGVLNSLNDLNDFLPFQVDFFEKITLQKLKATQLPTSQHSVIPLRIYLSALTEFTEDIKYWHNYKDELEIAVQTAFKYENQQASRLIKRLRNGQCPMGQVFNKSSKGYQDFIAQLDHMGIPLVDYGESELWDDLWDKYEPTIRTDFYEAFPACRVGNKLFNSHHEIKDFCRNLDSKCRYLVLCLSGMRGNELVQITPDFGAQVITLDGIDIHLFHTKQQKITLGYQGYNDVYVTTRTGHLAYELLNCMNRTIRNWHQEQGLKCWLLNTYTHFRSPRSVQRTGNITASIRKLFSENEHGFSVTLNSDDIEMLRRSDPDKTYNIGDKWHITPHQLRRSLAYYLVGMQLADYPQLKQQFSHYSIAMTMYYARNASSFKKMHHDIEQEKIRQQAYLYSTLVSEAQSGKRLGGGKGKKLFLESDIDRDISIKYFEKEIKSGKKHIHAIAPGMYCINRLCNMKISIDLPECTDCDWAIIENSAYTQGARQESINILNTLNDKGELTPDILKFHTMRIDAAETIMNDMGVSFTPFVKPSIKHEV